MGKALIHQLYTGPWHEGHFQKFSWSRWNTLLDVRAFLCCALGRVNLNAVYNMVFVLLVMADLWCEDIMAFNPPTDGPLLAFFVGQIAEEARELFKEPTYLEC